MGSSPGCSPSPHECSWVPPGLQVLETCVKNCGHRFHLLVASQDFVEGVLVRTILPKNNPPTIVHDKVLNLIQVSAGRQAGGGVGGCPTIVALFPFASVCFSCGAVWGRLVYALTEGSECGVALLGRAITQTPTIREGLFALWGWAGGLPGRR